MVKNKPYNKDLDIRVSRAARLGKKLNCGFLGKLFRALFGSKSEAAAQRPEGLSDSTHSPKVPHEAHPLEARLRGQSPLLVKKVLLNYTVIDTVHLLLSVSEETRAFILLCLDRDSSLSNGLTYFLTQPIESLPQSQKTIENLIFEIQLSLPPSDKAPITLSINTPKSIAADRTVDSKISDRATRKSLSLPSVATSLELHLSKTVLLYSYENPSQDSATTAQFLSELGLSIKASGVEEIWQRYELMDEEQRLQWATQGEEEMIPLHQNAAEIIRQHTS